MKSAFANRRKAGEKLAIKTRLTRIERTCSCLDCRAAECPSPTKSRALRAPLDVFLVRKLGVPGQEELAMGAIATGGVRVLNDEIIFLLGISESVIDAVAHGEQQELERREHLYRGNRPRPEVPGRTVILVDDGLATGSTMRAAAAALRQMRPSRIIVAVPVGAQEACEEFRQVVDEVICAVTPAPFMAVGAWYADFSQTSDDEVRDLLQKNAGHEQVSPTCLI